MAAQQTVNLLVEVRILVSEHLLLTNYYNCIIHNIVQKKEG